MTAGCAALRDFGRDRAADLDAATAMLCQELTSGIQLQADDQRFSWGPRC